MIQAGQVLQLIRDASAGMVDKMGKMSGNDASKNFAEILKKYETSTDEQFLKLKKAAEGGDEEAVHALHKFLTEEETGGGECTTDRWMMESCRICVWLLGE